MVAAGIDQKPHHQTAIDADDRACARGSGESNPGSATPEAAVTGAASSDPGTQADAKANPDASSGSSAAAGPEAAVAAPTAASGHLAQKKGPVVSDGAFFFAGVRRDRAGGPVRCSSRIVRQPRTYLNPRQVQLDRLSLTVTAEIDVLRKSSFNSSTGITRLASNRGA